MTASAEIRTPSTGAGRPADQAPRPSPRASANASVWGLVWTLVRTDFKARYHGTPSGFLWALLKPTAMFVVLVAVFSLSFSVSEPNYKLNLIIGLFLWDFFAEATTKSGMGSLAAKGFLVTKARFPRSIVVVTPDRRCINHAGGLRDGRDQRSTHGVRWAAARAVGIQ